MHRRVLYDTSSPAAAAAAHLLADEYDVGTLSADRVADVVPTVLLIVPDSRDVPQVGRHVRLVALVDPAAPGPGSAAWYALVPEGAARAVVASAVRNAFADLEADAEVARINRAFDEQTGYRTKSTLVVPMRTPQGETIGVFQLINCKPDFARRLETREEIERLVKPFSARHEKLAGSLASQAAVAIANSRLYEAVRQLFEGFVQASVTAIESRDPTTSGHSFRVANLTVALAEVVDLVTTGSYAPVRFTTDELMELRYAALLHDFGKVGVRE